MALENDLRAQLIKQFAADVVIVMDRDGVENYVCPTCKRQVAKSNEKCLSCEQSLKWDNIKAIELQRSGEKTATLSFKVSGDFVKGDCRKCPISYIGRRDKENVYECPLNKRNECPLVIE